MSSKPDMRRSDKVMSDAKVNKMLDSGYYGQLATVDANHHPYICPLLYVRRDDRIWLHNSRSPGHLRQNLRENSNACFSIAEPGYVFSYGRFECDTSIAYKSIIVFGKIDIVESRRNKESFFESLMAKYSPSDSSRPKNFFPRLDDTTVYSMSMDRVTGKETPLPAIPELWPITDNTKSPNTQGP